MKTIEYINLTNGIEALCKINNPRFLRIQSSHCEAKKWEDILNSASDDLLLNLAIGNKCKIYDYSQSEGLTRALWQGVEFIKFVLYMVWFQGYIQQSAPPEMCNYFYKQYKILEKTKTIEKIKYFRKFLNTDYLYITYACNQTTHDGDYKYFKEKLLNEYR